MRYQWILYTQLSCEYIQEGVTDIIYLFYTPRRTLTPIGIIEWSKEAQAVEWCLAKDFLDQCQQKGYRVHYRECQSYLFALREFLGHEVLYMEPSELYLSKKIHNWDYPNLIKVTNQQFLISFDEISGVFQAPPTMEYFYRFMRKKLHLLIDDDAQPSGGKWNFDSENRSFDLHHHPDAPTVSDICRESHDLWSQAGDRFGPLASLMTPLTGGDRDIWIRDFFDHHLVDFGRLEDAMYRGDDRVHHSFFSTILNFGCIHPRDILERLKSEVLLCRAPIASIEGFIRQVIGWREYMRYFFEFYAADIYDHNFFSHDREMPAYFWDASPARTTLSCVDHVIDRVKYHHYSHHIERLMIVGNFSLLMGYHPRSVLRWFWEQYIDAFEWVVVPNVLAMSQMSDGGRLATKPYISGGNYIDKMSDFCSGCIYSVKKKTCPMTPLYWDFIDRNREVYQKGRSPYALAQLSRLDMDAIRQQKDYFLQKYRTNED